MTNDDKQKFASQLAGVYSLYGKELSDVVIAIWWRSMERFDVDAVVDAFSRHVLSPDTGKFLPRPADIAGLIQGGTEDSSLKAWTELERAIRTIGAYQSVEFADAITGHVIQDMGGWQEMCRTTEKDLPFRKNEFVKRYSSYKRSGKELPSITHKGISELHNDAEGLENKKATWRQIGASDRKRLSHDR